mgnify:CR=1 FL=1
MLKACQSCWETLQKGDMMKKLTPVKAIRAKCLDCCNGQSAEVRQCTRPKGEQFTIDSD